VRVSPWFWLTGAILGFNSIERGWEYFFAWLAVIFVSILVHELGHGLTSKSFGYRTKIVLNQMGGVAMYEPTHRYTRWRSILISLAGPGAGFVLFGLVYAFGLYGPRGWFEALPENRQELIRFTHLQLVWVNLAWGLVNLLPVLPLDGGNICRDVFVSISPRWGELWAMRFGVGFAGIAAVAFYFSNMLYPAILFAMLGAQNVSALQAKQQRGPDYYEGQR